MDNKHNSNSRGYIGRWLRCSVIALAAAAGLAVPGQAGASMEIAKPGVIVMNHLPNPVYFDGGVPVDAETAIAAYRREIADMLAIGANSVALNASNNTRDQTRLGYWKEAVTRHNKEGRAPFCFFLLAGFDPLVWPAETFRSVYKSLADSPYHCSIGAKPVLAAFRGEQQTAEWYLSEVLDPLRAEGVEPFFLIFLPIKTEDVVGKYLDVWRARSYNVGFFRFSANTAQATVNIEEREKPLFTQKGYLYIPGFGTSKWAVCSSKPNSGVYVEHHAYEGLDVLWKAMVPGGTLNGDYTMLTIWNDFGEDNSFSPKREPISFYRNPDVPAWTHRGFHEFSRYYIREFRKQPQLKLDWVYWAYRQHPKDLPAPPGDECDEYAATPKVTGEIQDAFYVTTVLSAPAELRVKFGGTTTTFLRPAGISHIRVPWETARGQPMFVLVRGGTTVMARTGTLAITDTPMGNDGEGTRNFNHYADFMSKPAP